MNISKSIQSAGTLSAAALISVFLSGCAGFSADSTAKAPVVSAAISGRTFGGQQPVAGASIKLYAGSTAGYASANTNLLTRAVTTDAGGNFSFTASDYTCTTGQQMYLIATGGNPGAGTNPNLALMAALGDCANLNNLSFVSVNELTSIGSVFALAPFMTSGTALGTKASNTAGLARAFTSVNKLVNIGTGSSTGTSLPANATGPVSEINTLANIMAACVNSTGGVASNTNTSCGMLFSAATPASGVAPADTLQAMLNIAQNPTLSVASLYNIASAAAVFQPHLAAAPADWSLAIKYKSGAVNAPNSATIDAAGQIWLANQGNNTVTVLSQTGQPIAGSPFSGNGLSGPVAVAIDSTGQAWVSNKTGNTVSAFTSTGGAVTGSPFHGGGNLSGPAALAFDAPGNLFIANSTGSSVTKLSPTGSFLTQINTSAGAPSALAINPK